MFHHSILKSGFWSPEIYSWKLNFTTTSKKEAPTWSSFNLKLTSLAGTLWIGKMISILRIPYIQVKFGVFKWLAHTFPNLNLCWPNGVARAGLFYRLGDWSIWPIDWGFIWVRIPVHCSFIQSWNDPQSKHHLKSWYKRKTVFLSENTVSENRDVNAAAIESGRQFHFSFRQCLRCPFWRGSGTNWLHYLYKPLNLSKP